MSVTPILCITLAAWLGRGTVICAKAEAEKHNTNNTAKKETELRLTELMIFLLVDGFDGDDSKELRIQYRPYRSYMTYLTYNVVLFSPQSRRTHSHAQPHLSP